MSENSLKSIKSWAEDDRPREKLMLKGRSALSDGELLAIIIGSGNQNESAVELAKRILAEAQNNWHELAKMDLKKLCEFKGIGEAKAINILAAMEIGRRRAAQTPVDKPKVTGSQSAFLLFQPHLQDLPNEEFWVMFLNQANKVIKLEQLSRGAINQTVVDVRLLLRQALAVHAVGLILAHNHPSGNLQPSESDLRLTKKISEACKILDIQLIDHLILNQSHYFSFSDSGMIQ